MKRHTLPDADRCLMFVAGAIFIVAALLLCLDLLASPLGAIDSIREVRPPCVSVCSGLPAANTVGAGLASERNRRSPQFGGASGSVCRTRFATSRGAARSDAPGTMR